VSNDARSIFNSAQAELKSLFDTLNRAGEIRNQSLLLNDLIENDGWSLLNELLQNSIDINAESVKVTIYPNGDLKFQHDADIVSYPLDEKSIIGLCGIGRSTKGLDSVGFMGIGFKFFTRFFEKVIISDGKINFTLSYDRGDNPPLEWENKIKSLYHPKWNENMDELDDGYTTVFFFKSIFERKIGEIKEIFDTVNLENFALLSRKTSKRSGLKELIIERMNDAEDDTFESKKIFSISNDNNQTVIIQESENKEKYIIFSKVMVASEDSKNKIINKRRISDPGGEELRREISLILKIDEKDLIAKRRFKPNETKNNTGKLFCLVPLVNTTFPFKVYLDADWHMNKERTDLSNDKEAINWHTEMISETFPELIKQYLLFATTKHQESDFRRAIDIFPTETDQSVTSTGPPRFRFSELKKIPKFEFIYNKMFLSKMTVSLENCNFILTVDGKFQSPKNVKNIIAKPQLNHKSKYGNVEPVERIQNQSRHKYCDILRKEMKDDDYKKFIDTFTIPIIEKKFIEPRTMEYLEEYLNLISYPVELDYNIEKIRELWDEESPVPYLHIIDMISNMARENINGIKIIPLMDNNWGDLFEHKYIFEKIPNDDVKEKILYEKILDEGIPINESIMVHEKLMGFKKHLKSKDFSKNITEKIDFSGNDWKNKIIIDVENQENVTMNKPHISPTNSLYDKSLKIGETIKNINQQDKELLTSILHYSIRVNNPDLIKFLVSKDGSISPVQEIFLPVIFGGSEIQPKDEIRILSDSIVEIIQEGIESKNIEKDFLKRAGMIILCPIQDSEEKKEPEYVEEKTGIIVSDNDQTKHKSTRASTESNSLKNGWTITDYIWPIDIGEIEIESLYDFLSKPSSELKEIEKYCNNELSYFFNGPKGPFKGKKQAKWVEDINSLSWVKCSDGVFRKPSESPLNNASNPMNYHALLDGETSDFYKRIGIIFDSNMDEMSPDDCMKIWQRKPVDDIKLFIKKLNQLGNSTENIESIIKGVKWTTKGDYFRDTELKYFVQKASTTLGGFIGLKDDLDKGVKKELKKIGFKFEKEITLNMMKKCNNLIIDKYIGKKLTNKAENILHDNWKMILKNNYSLNGFKTLTSDMEISKPGRTYYLSPIIDDRRLNHNPETILSNQFPSDIFLIHDLISKNQNLLLLDQQIELDFTTEELDPAIEISMILESMGLEYKAFYCDGENITKFEGSVQEISFLLLEHNKEIEILIWRERKWIEDLCDFLIVQGGKEFSKGRKRLRNCLEIINNKFASSSFPPVYEEFCNFTSIEIFQKEDIMAKIGRFPERKSKPVEERNLARPKPAELRIEPKIVGRRDESKNKVSGKNTPKNKPIQSTVIAKENRNTERPKNRKSRFTTEEIGDIGEATVAKKLQDNGWEVEIMPKNNPGYDLLARKNVANRGEIIRYIEVKSKEGGWDDGESVKMTHQQGLHYFLTVEEDNGGGKYEYWLCIVDKIINDEKDDISKEISGIYPINLNLAKPDYIFNSTQWSKRVDPDKDFFTG
jgi:hypothetical protein